MASGVVGQWFESTGARNETLRDGRTRGAAELHRWASQFEQTENRRLRKENERLRMEKTFLKKPRLVSLAIGGAGHWFHAPAREATGLTASSRAIYLH
jgi:hypothetical protein